MYWRWTARRLAISAFLVVHLGAVAIMNLPPSALRQALIAPVAATTSSRSAWIRPGGCSRPTR